MCRFWGLGPGLLSWAFIPLALIANSHWALTKCQACAERAAHSTWWQHISRWNSHAQESPRWLLIVWVWAWMSGCVLETHIQVTPTETTFGTPWHYNQDGKTFSAKRLNTNFISFSGLIKSHQQLCQYIAKVITDNTWTSRRGSYINAYSEHWNLCLV